MAKLRISCQLDAKQPLSEAQRQAMARSTELRGFLEQTQVLEASLRKATPPPEPPVGLHAAIMAAVRTAEAEPAKAPNNGTLAHLLPRVLTACVLLVAIAMATDWWWHGSRAPEVKAADNQPLAAAAEALELGRQAANSMPAAVISPLTAELDRLNQDLTNTARFLMANLP